MASRFARSAESWGMPALTRKLVSDNPETWHIHFAGVRVGMLLERAGIVSTSQPWEWHCGFYPDSNPGEQRYGIAAICIGRR
jgi:hypothetical protein